MKKIDKLVLQAFIGPFLMTFLVVVFILLMQHMLKYFDDIIGKGLGADVIGQLLFYFAIFMIPNAMPLAVLLSSLIAFGNLGEHFELTAIKSSGISLVRTLRPIFLFVLILTALAFYANNNLVPKAALEAYSLLYDIKQKKPALDLREGAFYNGISDISIKVDKKFPEDEAALKNVVVYDHRKNDGNKEVTIADSGRMSTILNERYLKFELFNGYRYTEGAGTTQGVGGKQKGSTETLSRSKFGKTQVVYDLSSFQLERTDKKWFSGNRIMRNLVELEGDLDSIRAEILNQQLSYYQSKPTFFAYYNKADSVILPLEIYQFKLQKDSNELVRQRGPMALRDQIKAEVRKEETKGKPSPSVKRKLKLREASVPQKIRRDNNAPNNNKQIAIRKTDTTQLNASNFDKKVDSLFAMAPTREHFQNATNTARQAHSQVSNSNASIENYEKELVTFKIQWHQILANSLACVAMFLIGAPLGAIIKKGGLGMPFLVSILFFIIYYVLTMQGQKLAKQDTVSVAFGVWMADIILLAFGLFFLRQARKDARLFEADFYSVIVDKVRRWVEARKTRRVQHA